MEISKATYGEFLSYWRDADWARPQFGAHFLRDKMEFWYAKVDDTVVGRIYFFKNLSDPDIADGYSRGYICNLHVLREYRGHGIGTALIETIKSRAKEISFTHVTLGVDEQELANVRLYHRLGFTEKIKECHYDPVCRNADGNYEDNHFTLISCTIL